MQSAEVGTVVLKALAQLSPSTSLSALSKHIEMPAAKIHRYLQALIASGFAEQEQLTSRYRLGREALFVGLAALNSVDVYHAGGVALAELREAVDETCFLAVWGSEGATVIKVEPASRSVTVVTQIGSVLPMLRSSTGLVFSAYQRNIDVRQLLEQDAAQFNQEYLSQHEIEEKFNKIRSDRMCSVKGLLMPGINALSVPVFDAFGSIAAVLTMVGSQSSFSADLVGHQANNLARTGRELSMSLGFNA